MSIPTPPGEADHLLHDRVAFLCTLRPDGSPHQTPVWFIHLDHTWWIATAEHNVKVDNIVHDPRVSVAVLNQGSPVVAEGRALIHRTNWPADIVDAFAAKYDGWDVADGRPDGSRVMLSIAVTRWLMPIH